VTAPTESELKRFYDACYEPDASAAASARYARWRALGARTKAEHVEQLLADGDLRPSRVLDVGCGDGALMAELHRRGIGDELVGIEVSESAVPLARNQPGVREVSLFDGVTIPSVDDGFDVAILSHVLEHVLDPTALLAEARRVARAVIVEVPLEANLSARRPRKRAGAAEIGHLHQFGRADMRRIAVAAGFTVRAEVWDALPLSVHRFFSDTLKRRSLASIKWLTRRGASAVSAPAAARLFTLHYAMLLERGSPPVE